jgi:hypothetical protein
VRSQSSYLVVLMFVMGCLAVVRPFPIGLLVDLHNPANLIMAAALIFGAAAVARRRPSSFAIGLGAAGVTALAGVLGAAGVRGCRLPGYPLMWVVIGMYIAFRLSLVRNQEQSQQRYQRRERAQTAPHDPGETH